MNTGDPRHPLQATNELLQLARQGHQSALNEVYARYWPRLVRWASGRIPAGARSMQDTADVVQGVLAHFLQKVAEFQPRHDGALMAYLCLSVKNRLRDLARQAARTPDHLDIDGRDIAARGASPYELCVAADVRERYEAALVRLTDEQRIAVLLKVELGFGPTEIARAMNRPSPDAARVFTERALRRLAEEMSDG